MQGQGQDRGEGPSELRSYLARSRDLSFGIFLILPLLAVYEAGLVWLQITDRNGADIVIKEALAGTRSGQILLERVFALGGTAALTACNLAVIVLAAAVSIRILHRGAPLLRYVPYLLLEASIYALLFGPIALALQEGLGGLGLGASSGTHGLAAEVVLSLGAGVYEELLFRVFGLSLLYLVFRRLLHAGTAGAFVAALLLSSVGFAWFHHVGPWAGPFRWSLFVYRSFAGALLGIVFAARGPAVVVYSHALYDLFLLFGVQVAGGVG